jgi:cell division protein FtsX
MIRPASHALRERPYETAAVVLLLSLALVVPGVMLLLGARAHAHALGWLSAYEPVIYLSTELGDKRDDTAQALRSEVEAWSMVESARVRAPAQALEELRAKLGAERVQQLGLSEAMMPTSVILSPVVPLHGHIELAANVSGLEARDEVSAVDVPSADALRLMEAARSAISVALVIAIVMALVAAILLAAFLRRIRQLESHETELLEMFGASRGALRRPTMLRGAFLGVLSGVLATTTLLVTQLALARWATTLTGVDAGATWTWFIVILPVVLSPALGVLVGRLVAHGEGSRARSKSLPGTRPALVFGRSRFAPAR